MNAYDDFRPLTRHKLAILYVLPIIAIIIGLIALPFALLFVAGIIVYHGTRIAYALAFQRAPKAEIQPYDAVSARDRVQSSPNYKAFLRGRSDGDV